MQIPQKLFKQLRQNLLLNSWVALAYWGISHVIWAFFQEFGMLPAPIWPAAALALSAAFVLGSRVAPGIYLGALFANWLSLQAPLPVALGIAMMNTLAPVIMAHFIHQYTRLTPPFKSVPDIFIFVLFGVVLHAALTATGGVVSLWLGGRIELETLPFVWLRWWLAHASGAVLLAPTLILWSYQANVQLLYRRWQEYLILFMLSNITAFCIFFGIESEASIAINFPWLLIITLVWCSARFSQRETSTLLTSLLLISSIATVEGKGPFAMHTDMPMISLGLMSMVFAFSSLVLGAMSCERREEARQFQQLVQHSPIAKLVYNKDNDKIIMLNHAFEKHFGETDKDLCLSQWFEKICPDKDCQANLEKHWQWLESETQQKNNGMAEIELELYNRDLALRYVRVSLATIGSRYVATFSDLTEIHAFNEELEQRVAEQTADLRHSNEELQVSLEQLHETQDQLVEAEKMAALGRLVAGIAHEINTPIGIGVTATSHLQMKLEAHQQAYQQGQLTRSAFEDLLTIANESCNIIEANLQKAAELIRSFKRIAVEQSHLEKRWFELAHYLEEVLHTLQPRLKSTPHQVAIDCPEGLQIYSYPGVFSQIISNFILNSLKHGLELNSAGKMKIVISFTTTHLVIDYYENGKGIAPEHLKHVFEPFFTTRRDLGGTGLGLHIVYNLVTQTLGGKIECASSLGQGVHFCVRLPMAELQEHAEIAT